MYEEVTDGNNIVSLFSTWYSLSSSTQISRVQSSTNHMTTCPTSHADHMLSLPFWDALTAFWSASNNGCGLGWETDYVVSICLTPPHTIHPPHQISEILEESEIVFWRFQTHSNNIVSLFTTWYCSKLIRRSPQSGGKYTTAKLV